MSLLVDNMLTSCISTIMIGGEKSYEFLWLDE